MVFQMRSFARELRIWTNLNHPNILPCLGFAVDGNSPRLVSQWMENGNLIQYLEKNPGTNRMDMVSSCLPTLRNPNYALRYGGLFVGWNTFTTKALSIQT